jgi:hypothetical protein
MAENENGNMKFRNVSIPKDFWSMPLEKQREFARDFLMRFSPNEEVRKQSDK